MVTMKFIHKHNKSEKDIHNLKQGIEILRKLKHENIIEMLDSFESPPECCLVTEFAQGELFEVLEDEKCLPEDQVQAIAKHFVTSLIQHLYFFLLILRCYYNWLVILSSLLLFYFCFYCKYPKWYLFVVNYG